MKMSDIGATIQKAEAALRATAKHLSEQLGDANNEDAAAILSFLVNHSFITDAALGKMCHITRENVNRWRNKKVPIGYSHKQVLSQKLSQLFT
ncbi:MAG: hypothetical protein WAX89_03870 [Alphaproteobacteria bacterium]